MLKKIILIIFLFFQVFLVKFSLIDANDMLDEAFNTSKDNYQIVTQNISNNQSKVETYITNTTKTMLKFAVIIWVIVFLYGWIRFLLSMWDDSKAKKTRDTLIVSWIWLIIAFGSYVILELIRSIWHTLGNWF